MFRHCAESLEEKKERVEKTATDKERAEYYLGLEGFLLHLRNLLAFLMSRQDEPTDLGINNPSQWSQGPVDRRDYSDLMKAAREINDRHGAGRSTCYDQISKFLQHCTTYRHEQDRDWDVKQIFAEFDPILQKFERRFAPTEQTVSATTVVRTINNSTATMRTFSPLFDNEDSSTHSS